MRIELINTISEVNDCLFYLEYKVNGRFRAQRVTKITLINYIAINNEVSTDEAREQFHKLKWADLFDSYLKHFHTV